MGAPLLTCAVCARMLALMWRVPIIGVNHCIGVPRACLKHKLMNKINLNNQLINSKLKIEKLGLIHSFDSYVSRLASGICSCSSDRDPWPRQLLVVATPTGTTDAPHAASISRPLTMCAVRMARAMLGISLSIEHRPSMHALS
jgi:hypothetical protein